MLEVRSRVKSNFLLYRENYCLEHILFKNVSKWIIFLWQTQIKLNMALMIRKWEKRNKLHWYFTPLRPLNQRLWYEFSNVFVAQSDFGKKNTQKFTHLDHSYLKYTLIVNKIKISLKKILLSLMSYLEKKHRRWLLKQISLLVEENKN